MTSEKVATNVTSKSVGISGNLIPSKKQTLFGNTKISAGYQSTKIEKTPVVKGDSIENTSGEYTSEGKGETIVKDKKFNASLRVPVVTKEELKEAKNDIVAAAKALEKRRQKNKQKSLDKNSSTKSGSDSTANALTSLDYEFLTEKELSAIFGCQVNKLLLLTDPAYEKQLLRKKRNRKEHYS